MATATIYSVETQAADIKIFLATVNWMGQSWIQQQSTTVGKFSQLGSLIYPYKDSNFDVSGLSYSSISSFIVYADSDNTVHISIVTYADSDQPMIYGKLYYLDQP